MLRGVNNMLHTVEDDGSRLANVQHAFDPQDIFAMCIEQHTEPDAKRHPIERLLKGQSD